MDNGVEKDVLWKFNTGRCVCVRAHAREREREKEWAFHTSLIICHSAVWTIKITVLHCFHSQ